MDRLSIEIEEIEEIEEKTRIELIQRRAETLTPMMLYRTSPSH